MNPDEERLDLLSAALLDDVAAISEALSAGHSPDTRGALGMSPLHFAAQEYSVRAAEFLLEEGASVDLENDYGNTPLFVAVFNSKGRGELIRALLRHGADPRHANHGGQTPVGLAAQIANYDVAQFLTP